MSICDANAIPTQKSSLANSQAVLLCHLTINVAHIHREYLSPRRYPRFTDGISLSLDCCPINVAHIHREYLSPRRYHRFTDGISLSLDCSPINVAHIHREYLSPRRYPRFTHGISLSVDCSPINFATPTNNFSPHVYPRFVVQR